MLPIILLLLSFTGFLGSRRSLPLLQGLRVGFLAGRSFSFNRFGDFLTEIAVLRTSRWCGLFRFAFTRMFHSLGVLIPRSTGFRYSDFCWRTVEPHGCSGAGITVVPEPNGQMLLGGPRASRVTLRAHNGEIQFSPWHYLNLLDLHSLETLTE
jgi:hypothetical protein